MKVELNPEWEAAPYADTFIWRNGDRNPNRRDFPKSVHYRTLRDAQLKENVIPMFLVDGIPTHFHDVPEEFRTVGVSILQKDKQPKNPIIFKRDPSD